MMALFLRSVAMKQGNFHITNVDGSVVQNLPADAGDAGYEGLVPGPGRSPGGGHGNPLQYSFLENPMDRGAWRVIATGVTKRQTQPKRLSTHATSQTRFLKGMKRHRQSQQTENFLQTSHFIVSLEVLAVSNSLFTSHKVKRDPCILLSGSGAKKGKEGRSGFSGGGCGGKV